MSPEQAKGRPADKRSDVWAFGCVLYEMLAGQRAFEGEDISETLAAVLRAEVDLTLLPHGTPQAVRRLLRRTFAKNPADRLRDVGDARLDLNGSALEPSDARGADHGSSWLRHQVAAVPWIVALIALIVASRLAMRAPVPAARPVIRFRVVMPPDSALSVGPNLFQLVVALSPDGTKLAYIALEENNTTTLHVHSMDRLDSVSLQDTSGATAPFFSPDGQWIGFSAAGLLRKIAVNGGAPVTICEPGSARGATWLPDDTIVFTPATGAGLLRVPSSGGKPVVVADPNAPDEQSLRYPDSLPGGRALLFTIQRHTGDFNSAAIGVLRLDTGERRVLLEGGSSPHYVPDGHMAFVRAGSVFVVPFDVSTLSVKGTPVPVIDGVLFSPNQGTAQFAVSGTGSAVYVAGRVAQGSQTLVWVDRHGVVETVPAPAQNYEFPRLSPDGRQIAVSINGSSAAGLRDVWLYDLARHTLSRLTFEKEEAETPLWTPDGKRVTYALQCSGRREFAWKLADGSAQEDVFVPTDQHFHLGAWSPDGERLVAAATESGVDAGSLWLLELKPKPTVRPLLKTQRAAQAPAISPDGNWLAYSANDTNRFEIYVQAFPGPGGKYQISTEGGVEPRWNPNGRELFYRSGNKMMAVSVRTSGNTFESDTPQLLFDGKFTVMDGAHDAWYDVARDGQRFLMMRRTDAQNTTDMVVIHDWSSELATRVPSK